MKISLLILLLCICPALNAQEDSDKGHAEHFVAGTSIGGVTSYFVFKKTNDKWKSWLIGAGTAVVVGLAKEAIDPAIGGTRSAEDFAYTALGGAFGACIVIPLKSKPKEVVYLY